MDSVENPHDKIFKEIVSQPELAADLIQGLCPAPLVSCLDFATCTHETNSYIDSFLVESYSDLVYNMQYRIPHTDSKACEVKVALLLEHKSFKPQNEFLQLLRYMLNIWESQQKDDIPLQPVIPIIVYHGKTGWKARRFKSMITGIDNTLLPYFPDFGYVLANIRDHANEALREQLFTRNAIKLLTLLYRNHSDAAFLKKNTGQLFTLILDELEKQDSVGISLLVYFTAITEMGYKEIIQEIKKVSTKGGKTAMTAYEQLINEGLNQGLDLGIRKVAQNMLKNGMNVQTIIENTGLSFEDIQSLQAQQPVYSDCAENRVMTQ